MENLTPNSALTIETLMAAIHESNRFLTEKIAETERLRAETERQRAETERQRAETERQRADNERQRAESEQQRAESEQQRAETERQHAETERQHAETERQHAETERQQKENWEKYERRMKNMEKLTGSWSNNHGTFAEEYFYNAFLEGEQNFFGEQFDKIRNQVHHVTPKLEDEYDIVMYNHTSIAIIEAKYTAHVNDIAKTLKKAETFRILCPEFKDFNIYLGLASMSFYPELEKKCTEQGIAIIKQVGDMVVINDKHLKVF